MDIQNYKIDYNILWGPALTTSDTHALTFFEATFQAQAFVVACLQTFCPKPRVSLLVFTAVQSAMFEHICMHAI